MNNIEQPPMTREDWLKRQIDIPKIVILGAGNAGCLSAISTFQQPFKKELELIYDPSIPAEPVGMGTTPWVPEQLFSALEANWWSFAKEVECTPKFGILYKNWGKKGEENFHGFPMPTMGIHFNPDKFQKAILNSGVCKVKEENINDLDFDSIDADYIIDCRGKPSKEDLKEKYRGLNSPVNSVLLGAGPPDESQKWTLSEATPHGWTFGIPLPNSINYGYLYNNTITTDKEAEEDFTKRFDVEVERSLTFSNYCIKKEYLNLDAHSIDRVFLNGNKAWFLEPLEASSLEVYGRLCERFNHYIIAPRALRGDPSKNTGLSWHTGRHIHFDQWTYEFLLEIELFINYHYQFGSKFDTPFWDFAKEKTKYVNDNKAMKRFMDVSFDPNRGLSYESFDLLSGIPPGHGDYPKGWGIWGYQTFRNWYFAMYEEGYVDHYQRSKTRGLLNPKYVV